jgi:2-amino-4-hydroxy-6-hydroxymethyldihydropteridine diphosphokinase
MMAAETAYLGLGSNLGDRKDNLDKAVAALDLTDGITVTARSRQYDSAPIGLSGAEPRFLNEVIEVSTALSPERLLEITERVESRLGRTGKGLGRPRPIDIDILFYGARMIETQQLTVPHPRLQDRAFVLRPLADIAPAKRHPVSEKTIGELAAAVADQDVRLYHGG